VTARPDLSVHFDELDGLLKATFRRSAGASFASPSCDRTRHGWGLGKNCGRETRVDSFAEI